MIKSEKLLKCLSEIPEVVRISEIEKIIDSNEDLQKLFELYLKKQHEIVFARQHDAGPVLKKAKEDYEEIKNKMFEVPLFSEYLELLESVNFMIQNISKTIEEEINKTF